MAEHIEPLGKRVWCDKSVFAIEDVEFLELAFPSARYVCLYRNSLDQVASALETLSTDMTGKIYGFDAFLARNRREPWNALADYWIARTRKILAFEEAKSGQCFRVRYEDIVQDTDARLESLFASLGSHWSEEMTASIFKRARKGGRGDTKIQNTDRILKTSVGRGQDLVKKITIDRQRKINELHAVIGYQPIKR